MYHYYGHTYTHVPNNAQQNILLLFKASQFPIISHRHRLELKIRDSEFMLDCLSILGMGNMQILTFHA